jgi:hypothetical protein
MSLNVEFYIGAAQKHGEDSEPGHEVGDLQAFLRAAWKLLTPEQRVAFSKCAEVGATIYGATGYDSVSSYEESLLERDEEAPSP